MAEAVPESNAYRGAGQHASEMGGAKCVQVRLAVRQPSCTSDVGCSDVGTRSARIWASVDLNIDQAMRVEVCFELRVNSAFSNQGEKNAPISSNS
jgi:hypothetical protein